MDYVKLVQRFWDHNAKSAGHFSEKCTREDIKKAKNGQPDLYVLCDQPIPLDWHPQNWEGIDVLAPGLAGGSHTPLMAAAGANVTSLDLSREQLQLDEDVCRKYGLQVTTQQGDVQDLSRFPDESFDYVITATVSIYIKEMEKFWSEVYRVLRPGGTFVSGAVNPIYYAFDPDEYQQNRVVLKNKIPYDSTQDLTPNNMLKKKKLLEPFQFGHSLEDIIGGQIEAGFSIVGFKEGVWGHEYGKSIDAILPTIMALKAQKDPN